MGYKSKIEWTDATWNPLRGCSKVSEGCRNCYAARVAARFSGEGQPYEGLAEMTPHGPRWTGKVQYVMNALNQPLKWRKPRRIFVNSMSDLFHEAVPDWFIFEVFDVMYRARWHTFQILTKRPERMWEWVTWYYEKSGIERDVYPNVWLGVSVENQRVADERIPLLLQTPAAVRFLSMEPLLGPVDLTNYLPYQYQATDEWGAFTDLYVQTGVDWVIVGGESGPGARPMHPDWVRSIRDQCQAAGVAFHFKQWGEWSTGRRMSEIEIPSILSEARDGIIAATTIDPPRESGETRYVCVDTEGRAFEMVRVGKKSAGRLLDGRTWDEFPEVVR